MTWLSAKLDVNTSKFTETIDVIQGKNKHLISLFYNVLAFFFWPWHDEKLKMTYGQKLRSNLSVRSVIQLLANNTTPTK